LDFDIYLIINALSAFVCEKVISDLRLYSARAELITFPVPLSE
jgi:hypothetical protein